LHRTTKRYGATLPFSQRCNSYTVGELRPLHPVGVSLDSCSSHSQCTQTPLYQSLRDTCDSRRSPAYSSDSETGLTQSFLFSENHRSNRLLALFRLIASTSSTFFPCVYPSRNACCSSSLSVMLPLLQRYRLHFGIGSSLPFCYVLQDDRLATTVQYSLAGCPN